MDKTHGKIQLPEWSIEFDRGFRSKVKERRSGGWDLTLTPGKVLSLIFREEYGRLYDRIPANGQMRLRMRVAQSPDVVWDSDPNRVALEPSPPKISLVVATSMRGVAKRFYSSASAAIDVDGIVTVNAPIDPDHWIHVLGKPASYKRHLKDGWREVMTSPYARVGIACGGFFKSKGFGVTAGSAKLSLVSLKL